MAILKESDVIIPVVYGQNIVDGLKIYEEHLVINNNEQYYLMVYVLAEGPIHAFNEIELNEKPLFNVSGIDYKSGVIGKADLTTEFRDHVQVELWNGERTGKDLTLISSNTKDIWKKTSTLNGRAAVALKIRLGGAISTPEVELRAKIKGLAVRDIRYETAERVYDYNGTEMDAGTNPVLCLFDYLTSTEYGASFKASELDTTSFIQGANWCDTHRFTFNGVVAQDDEYKKLIELMLGSFSGKLTRITGLVRLLLNQPQPSTEHFDLSETINKIKIEYQARKKDFNQLEVTYNTLAFKDNTETVLYPPTNDDPFILKDNKVKKEDLKLPFTRERAQVDMLATMMIRENMEQTEIEFETVERGFNVQVNDVITISLAEANWVKKPFRITEHNSDIFGNNPLTVKIKATEYISEVYDPAWQGVQVVKPQALGVPSPSNLRFTFEDSKFGVTGKLEWDQNITTYESHVMYKLSAEPDTAFQRYSIVRENFAVITDLKNAYYDFYVVNKNITGQTSDICYLRKVNCFDATVLPKVTNLKAFSESPDFTFTWDNMLDADIKISNPKTPTTLGSSKVKDVFLGYKVEVIVNNKTVHEQITQDTKFVYDFETNTRAGISRNVTVNVSIVSRYGARSPVNTVNAINYQQQVLSGIEVSGGLAGITVKFDAPTANDYRGVLVHMSTSRGFKPAPDNVLADLTSTNFLHHSVADANTYFFRLGAYDCFGRDQMVYSPEFSASVKDVNGMLADVSADKLSKDLIDLINGKSDTTTVNTIKTDLEAKAKAAQSKADKAVADALAAQSKADKAVADALAASNKATTEANRVLSAANTKATTDINAAKAIAIADLNAAKAELNKAIADSVVDLAPVNAKILAVEKASVDADKAASLKIDGVLSTSNNNKANITSLSKTVTANNSALSTKIDTVQATAAQQATAAESNAKAFATASVTTEKNARVAADSALTTQVNSVKSTADKNTADIITVNTSLVTKETALSNRIDAVQSSVNGVDGKVQTEITTRSTADTALGKRIDSVSATANKNTADIKTVNTTLAEKDLAMASRVTSMETSLKADSASKAATAEANAKVAAAADAAAKANKALADAKADAIGKANSAEANAKLAAATDAAAKANKALADAKAYSDANDVKATALTTAKFNEAVSLINTKDAAQAQRTSTLESAVSLSIAQIDNQETNWDFKRDRLNWSTGDIVNDSEVGKCIEITGNAWPTNDVFIRVDPKRTYRLSAKIKQQVYSGSSYSYLGVRTYDANYNELLGGAGNYRYCGKSGGDTPSEWTEFSGIITGTGSASHNQFRDGTCYIKIMMIGNYSGGKGKCRFADFNFEDITEQLLTNAKITSVENTIATKDSAMASRVTSMETSLKADSASKAATAEANAKVDAAKDAKAKADAALAAAKADASGKAATAESNAKLAAATDAAAKANKALADAKTYSDANDVKATALTTSKFNDAVNLINDKDIAQAKAITDMATSLKADSASKAATAEANAKVAAAADAKAKADAALAAAKADASGKAATAESNAKIAAATDAAAKANKALADAKAYADQKKNEAITYSDAKYNQAVSLINTKDSAQASLITSLESNVNRISSNSEQQVQDDCIFNSRFTLKNKENRPTGWFATYGSASPTNIGFSSDVNNGAYLISATTAGVGMCSTAFRVRDGVEYVIRIKVKAQVAKPNGFYFRINEYDAELPRGKVAVGHSTSEAVVQQNTRQITAFRDNQAIGTAWEEYTWTYKPTVTAQYASALVLNWEGMGKNNALYIDYISIEAVVSKDYTDAKYNQAVSLINTKDAAQASRVTDMATSLKADSASKAATAEANAKVAAAADAKAKADAALAAAKTDATSKANSAESNAKVQAATDAATKANKALADAKAYSDANDVKATALTTAKFNEAVNLINTKDAAQASRVTSMETSLKADSATKANKALADAKVAAAADAKAKADAALAAAKADASSKANSAESNAKVQAATDAATKANKALADAKAYSDVKKNEAVAYSDAKYNQAVSLINTKDAAQAKVITSLETSLKADSQTKANIARDAVIAELNNRSNLLQKYLPNWKLGSHPSSCGMGQNGETNENRFVMSDDPFGTKSVVWEMSTNSSANSDADGGISSAWFDCDSKKSYRYSVYVKRTIANGTTYLGAGQSGETLELNGVTQTNPYFWSSVLPEVNKWYLIVGVMQAESGTIDSGISGLYDCETGQRVSAGKDYKIKAGAVRQYLRAYLYYSNNTNAKQYFWAPRVDVIDGNEPSLTSMMPMVAVNALSNANAAQAYATAKYNEVVSTITTKDNAQTSRVTTMEASLKTDAQNRANKALTDAKAYSDANDVKATALTTAKFNEAVNLVNTKDSAQAKVIANLSSTVNGHTSSITTTHNTLATLAGRVNATWALRLAAGNKIAGIGLANDGATSAFSVQADSFKIYANGVDNAVFAVEGGKLIVKSAHIGVLDSANIKAGAIDAGHLSASAITAAQANFNGANIKNGTISFLKIADDMRSTNFVLNKSGWQLSKAGALNATLVNISGVIKSSVISGSFIEGSLVMGSEDFLIATQASNPNGLRKACYSGLEVSGSVLVNGSESLGGSISAGGGVVVNNYAAGVWSEYCVLPMASASYDSAGVTNIATPIGNVQIANEYNRFRTTNIRCSGNTQFETAGLVVGYTYTNIDCTFRCIVEVQGINAAGAATTIGSYEICNQAVVTAVANSLNTYPLKNGWKGQLILDCGTQSNTNKISLKSAKIRIDESAPIPLSGNYKSIRYRVFFDTHAYRRLATYINGGLANLTFKAF